MNMLTYLIVAVLLLKIEILYFRIAKHYNIVDKPNSRSSHAHVTLRGGRNNIPYRNLDLGNSIWLCLSLVHRRVDDNFHNKFHG